MRCCGAAVGSYVTIRGQTGVSAGLTLRFGHFDMPSEPKTHGRLTSFGQKVEEQNSPLLRRPSEDV